MRRESVVTIASCPGEHCTHEHKSTVAVTKTRYSSAGVFVPQLRIVDVPLQSLRCVLVRTVAAWLLLKFRASVGLNSRPDAQYPINPNNWPAVVIMRSSLFPRTTGNMAHTHTQKHRLWPSHKWKLSLIHI